MASDKDHDENCELNGNSERSDSSEFPNQSDDSDTDYSSENESTIDSYSTSDTKHSLGSGQTGHDSDHLSDISISLSDGTFSHYSIEGNNISEKAAGCHRANEIYNGDDKKECTRKMPHLTKVTKNLNEKKILQWEASTPSSFTVPSSYEEVVKETTTDMVKEKFLSAIPKHSLHNTDHTDGRTERVKEILKRLKCAKLIKLETFAAINDYLKKVLENELVGHLDDDHIHSSIKSLFDMLSSSVNSIEPVREINDHVFSKEKTVDNFQFKPGVGRDITNHQSDGNYYLDKINSLFKFQSSQTFRQNITVMLSVSEDLNWNDNESQENPADNQGDQADVPADSTGQEVQDDVQVAGLPEGVGTLNHQTFSQRYLPQLPNQEERTSGRAESVLPVSRSFKLPENSELVTFSSCSAHLGEDQHMTSVISHFQQVSKILTAKGISADTIVKLCQAIVGYIPLLQSCIIEVLTSIVGVINDAEDVLAIGNICRMLPLFIEQVSKMLVTRPIQVTETLDDVSSAVSSTSDLCTYSKFHGELRHFPLSETTYASHNQARPSVNPPADNFRVTCHPQQDTDEDVGYLDRYPTSDAALPLTAPDYYHSAPAFSTNEVEAYELLDNSYRCHICGMFICQREREMNTALNSIRCSMQRINLLTAFSATVNFNAFPNCIPEFLWTRVPPEMLQRNLALGCLGSQPRMTEVNPVILSRIRDSFSSFVNSRCMNTSSLSIQPTTVNQHDLSSVITENGEGPIFLASVQNWIDRLYNQFSLFKQSTLRPFVQAIMASGYLPLHIEYMQRHLSSLPGVYVNILPNASSSKLSITITVRPDCMDQLKGRLVDSIAACRYQDSITGSCRMPPVDTFSNVPLIVCWTVTIQPSSLLQVDFDTVESIDPVEAVNIHNKESLVVALQPTYSHDEEQNGNPVGDFNHFVETPVSDPNNQNKSKRLDIFSFFSAEYSSYEHYPLNDTSINSNQVNCEAQETTNSDNSSDSEGKV